MIYMKYIFTIGILAAVLGASLFLTSNQFSFQQQQAITQGQQQETAVGQKIVQQGTVSSDVDPLKGHESHQAAVILSPRNDSAVYSGTLTFTASKPVQVAVINLYNLDNATTAQIPWHQLSLQQMHHGTPALLLLL